MSAVIPTSYLQIFSKCGVIKEDDERRPRVKVYRDRESGMPKGDGLVTYLKDPSVSLSQLAVHIVNLMCSILKLSCNQQMCKPVTATFCDKLACHMAGPRCPFPWTSMDLCGCKTLVAVHSLSRAVARDSFAWKLHALCSPSLSRLPAVVSKGNSHL